MPPTPEAPDRGQDQVLGRDARAELARVVDPHRLGPLLDQALGREHVLDLRGADPDRERAEGAMRGGVAVAADDHQARLGEAELGADHVDDALTVGAQRVDRDAELGAVALQRLDLDPRQLVGDQARGRGAVGGHVVVGGGDGLVGAADPAALEPQPVERLRRGHLVDEVQVDVDQPVGDLVGVPDLVEHGLRQLSSSAGPRRPRRAARPARPPSFSKWCGRSASKVTLSPARSSWRSPSMTSDRRPLQDHGGLAAPGLVERRIAGAAGRGARVEPVPGDVGALARAAAGSAPRPDGLRGAACVPGRGGRRRRGRPRRAAGAGTG